MTSPFRWHALVHTDVGDAVARFSEAVGRAGGYVLDARGFSNKAVCLTLEVAPERQLGLVDALRAQGVSVSVEAETGADTGTLRLDLVHAAPDRRAPIPMVPG